MNSFDSSSLNDGTCLLFDDDDDDDRVQKQDISLLYREFHHIER